jgi:hypothetical protein
MSGVRRIDVPFPSASHWRRSLGSARFRLAQGSIPTVSLTAINYLPRSWPQGVFHTVIVLEAGCTAVHARDIVTL